MDNTQIKKIESLGKKIGLKQKPPVINRGILFIAGFLDLSGFKTIVSDGLCDKNNFILPCIVLDAENKPKIRFKNQARIFKKYLTTVKKRSTRQLDYRQYMELLTIANKEGESKEYTLWRKKAMIKKKWLENLLNKYNKKIKNINKKEQFSVLEFEDGTIRLSFGDQFTDQPLIKRLNMLPLIGKRKKMNQFMNEFSELKKYLTS